MQKLLTKFRQTQSAKDALKLLAYLDKHPFGVVLASIDDQTVVETLQAKRDRALEALRLSRAA